MDVLKETLCIACGPSRIGVNGPMQAEALQKSCRLALYGVLFWALSPEATMRICTLWATPVCFALATLPSLTQSPGPLSMAYKSAAETKLVNHPALPSCASVAVQDGDP